MEPTFSLTTSGDYSVSVEFQCGTYTDEMTVIYDDYDFEVDLGRDTTFCFGDSIVLEAYSPYALTYVWQDASVEEQLIVKNTGNYSVTISDRCKEASDEIFLQLVSCCEVFVPNVFSPNFDGFNDEFQTFSNCVFPDYDLKVYNRWGAVVFQTKDQNIGWDGSFKGKEGQEGVYTWLLAYNDGVEDQILAGSVTLVK